RAPTKLMSNGKVCMQDAWVRGPVGEPRPSDLQTRVAGPGLSHTRRTSTVLSGARLIAECEPTMDGKTNKQATSGRLRAPATGRSQRPPPSQPAFKSQDRLA
ncbi:hypothetical protein GGTG_12705, partial [Gaeumannomyces tritici R3-111a-1]